MGAVGTVTFASALATKHGNDVRLVGYDKKECEGKKTDVDFVTKWEFFADEKLPCDNKERLSRTLRKEDYPTFKQHLNALVMTGRDTVDTKESYTVTHFEKDDCTGKTVKKFALQTASKYDCLNLQGSPA